MPDPDALGVHANSLPSKTMTRNLFTGGNILGGLVSYLVEFLSDRKAVCGFMESAFMSANRERMEALSNDGLVSFLADLREIVREAEELQRARNQQQTDSGWSLN